MTNCRTSGLALRQSFPIADSHRSSPWEAFEAMDPRELGSEYSERLKFPTFPPLLCVGNVWKIRGRFSVFGKIGVRSLVQSIRLGGRNVN
jgi:hypothetical protein